MWNVYARFFGHNGAENVIVLGEGVVSKSLSTLSTPIVVKKGEEVTYVSYRLTLLSLAP